MKAAAETKECVKGSGPSRKIRGLFLKKDPLTKPGSDHERGRDPWPSPLPGPRHGTGDGEPADELDVGGSMKSEAIGPIGPSTKSGESAERSAAADGLGSTPLLAEGRRFCCVGRVPNAKVSGFPRTYTPKLTPLFCRLGAVQSVMHATTNAASTNDLTKLLRRCSESMRSLIRVPVGGAGRTWRSAPRFRFARL